MARLEAKAPAVCEECGGEPPKGGPVEVTWDWDEDEPQEDLGPLNCPACGRTLRYEVHWPPELI